jgi:hypothetical protein
MSERSAGNTRLYISRTPRYTEKGRSGVPAFRRSGVGSAVGYWYIPLRGHGFSSWLRTGPGAVFCPHPAINSF